MDLLSYLLVRGFFFLLNLLPLSCRLRLVSGILRLGFIFSRRHKKIALKNLNLAFPEESTEWKNEVLRRSFDSLARLVIDFARLPRCDEKWVREHVDFPDFELFKKINSGEKGLILATGHLGSFELMAHCSAILG